MLRWTVSTALGNEQFMENLFEKPQRKRAHRKLIYVIIGLFNDVIG
jgi:hypothetical protein